MEERKPDSTENLGRAIAYLGKLIRGRIEVHLGKREEASIAAPDFSYDDSPFTLFLRRRQPEYAEYVTLLLALVPHLRVNFFDDLLADYFAPGVHFPIFGGTRGANHRGLLPTGETVQFILAGENLAQRLQVARLFSPEHWFHRQNVLGLSSAPTGEPPMAGQLIAQPEWVEQILTGKVSPPAFSSSFPAERVETQLEWTDLVLPERSLTELNYLRNYLATEQSLAGNSAYGKHSRRGYRALFHGPPGTGKTLSAALLGRATNRPVFRVDLSMVVSKWIGETEKNLAKLFQRAESKGWILFFDEADALFGKRSEVKESNSQYANQTTSFLLQRVENYDGLCILATNFRSNLDRAFTRRFEAIVPFFPPAPAERQRLWQSILPPALPMEAGLDPHELAEHYELTGAGIANVVRHAVLESLAAGASTLSKSQLLAAIVREYAKEDRVVKPGIL
ncbi:ATP-binding protein [Neolewinella lacunae]|uniref:ATP-binding protein n=1 Tax=Neolewinella lacunae TaxID=1517758 RepID=A0A923PIK8_9BACT|nr:ATP-binding protein [Neolewinella lacunae]MBC6993260.1 ATP-binding protein [Neolewinella lacunae]MDN3635693.1 ATP-binding protein [Neolewinella lacunae]